MVRTASLPKASGVLCAALLLAGAGEARADVTHVIARGHTLDAIARRYHVTVKAIMETNHLRDPRHLKVGDTLTIPGVQGAHTGAPSAAKGKAPQKPPTYAMRARTPGVIHAARLATSEDFSVRVSDRRGHVSPTATKVFERMLRSAGNQTHPIEPRLMALVALVSDHFGSRKLEVISGFRPYTSTQHTAHSNHNIGHAIDFRVVGVPNEVLRDYCRTLRNVGVGYYPNSTFVHLDARPGPAYWVDYSKPGEPPRYDKPNADADEGTSDVSDEVKAAGPPQPAPSMDGTTPGAQESAPPQTTPTPLPSAAPSPSESAAPAAPSAPPEGGSVRTTSPLEGQL